MAEDVFARSERSRVPPTSRPAPPSPAEGLVTIVCGCGVTMILAWRTAEPIHCVGCERVFAPPPTITAAPLRWRPELAGRRDSALPQVALAATIAAVLLLLLGLALRLVLAHP